MALTKADFPNICRMCITFTENLSPMSKHAEILNIIKVWMNIQVSNLLKFLLKEGGSVKPTVKTD